MRFNNYDNVYKIQWDATFEWYRVYYRAVRDEQTVLLTDVIYSKELVGSNIRTIVVRDDKIHVSFLSNTTKRQVIKWGVNGTIEGFANMKREEFTRLEQYDRLVRFIKMGIDINRDNLIEFLEVANFTSLRHSINRWYHAKQPALLERAPYQGEMTKTLLDIGYLEYNPYKEGLSEWQKGLLDSRNRHPIFIKPKG